MKDYLLVTMWIVLVLGFTFVIYNQNCIIQNQTQILSTLQTIQIQTGVDYAQDVEKIKTELPERGKE